MNYWLMKSEPNCFSIDDLKNSPSQTSPWDGVRNYQARNFIKSMQPGDPVLFYHSNINPPGIIGTVRVSSEPYPDATAFDPNSDHPDPRSTAQKPVWFVVDVTFDKKFTNIIPLPELKTYPELDRMPLLRKGNRLSVMPVKEDEWQFILKLAEL